MKTLLDNILKIIIPPKDIRIPFIITVAVIIGFSIFLMKITNAFSYLNTKPETCINCHVMQSQFSTWSHGSHREYAKCVDCHLPHDNLIHKFYVKGRDGMKDVVKYTFRMEHNVIEASDETKEIIENNCISCHETLMSNVHPKSLKKTAHHWKGKRCWDCHREVPHGKVKGLQSVIKSEMHLKSDKPVPDWLSKQFNK